jgi:SAM-dependent methyltransferase
MNTNPPSDPTVAYYDAHAARYAADTMRLDMSGLYEAFLALIPPGGHILDAGCGPGRDSLAFLRRGYRVTAFDASAEMAGLAAKVTGLNVAVLRLQDLAYEEQFDGVWACASLLHVPRREMGSVVCRLTRALRPGGVLYVSFKFGQEEGCRDGRFFNDYTDMSVRDLIGQDRCLQVIDIWFTQDLRPERRGEAWTNALARKRDDTGSRAA